MLSISNCKNTNLFIPHPTLPFPIDRLSLQVIISFSLVQGYLRVCPKAKQLLTCGSSRSSKLVGSSHLKRSLLVQPDGTMAKLLSTVAHSTGLEKHDFECISARTKAKLLSTMAHNMGGFLGRGTKDFHMFANGHSCCALCTYYLLKHLVGSGCVFYSM